MDSALADHSCAATSGTIVTTTVPASALPLQGNLTNVPYGVAYVCYAIANNGVAGEQCSAASNVVQASRSPSAPTVVNATSPASGRIDVSFTRREFYMPPNAPTMGAAAWSSSMELTVTFQASSR